MTGSDQSSSSARAAKANAASRCTSLRARRAAAVSVFDAARSIWYTRHQPRGDDGRDAVRRRLVAQLQVVAALDELGCRMAVFWLALVMSPGPEGPGTRCRTAGQRILRGRCGADRGLGPRRDGGDAGLRHHDVPARRRHEEGQHQMARRRQHPRLLHGPLRAQSRADRLRPRRRPRLQPRVVVDPSQRRGRPGSRRSRRMHVLRLHVLQLVASV